MTQDSFALVIFGITGNLAQLKLIPVLYDLEANNLLPDGVSIIGTARSPKTDKQLRIYLEEVLQKNTKNKIDQQVFDRLMSKVSYLSGNLDDPNFYPNLEQHLHELTLSGRNGANRIYYLATYPELYAKVFENLDSNRMNRQENGWVRLMIEKPIGVDLPSSKKLNTLLGKYFSEDQIYRIDHYLGKETIQNILTFRFGNGVFEHLINKDFIDHIQITMAEDFGIKKRGGFYDKIGALKDVGQNHLLQMLAFVTMDSPSELSNKAITEQRIKILQKLRPQPEKLVLGQYEGYLDEDHVAKNSKTNTFFAFKTEIDNERFRNVPIYIRGGKMLKTTVTEIVIVFKNPGNNLFKDKTIEKEQNSLVFRIQPNEGIILNFLVKTPGHNIQLDSTHMQFCYKMDSRFQDIPEAYERLIMDTIRGDQTFFNDAIEVESQWHFIDQLNADRKIPIKYEKGSWGPKEAEILLEQDGRKWLEPSTQYCSF